MVKIPIRSIKKEVLEFVNESYGIHEMNFSIFSDGGRDGLCNFKIVGEIIGEELKKPALVAMVALNEQDEIVGTSDFRVEVFPNSFGSYYSFELTIEIPEIEEIRTVRAYLIDNFRAAEL